MSEEERGDPWGRILTILTILAIANAWFKPFEGDDAPIVADYASSEQSPLVRHTEGWTPARKATITPGIQTITGGSAQCTTNFVFTDRERHVYLGQAAHCAGLDEQLNGCRARSRPLGTEVIFTTGATRYDVGHPIATGRLVYSSWRTMQARHERQPVRCAYNDFALVQVPRRHVRLVNPSVPYWGGPTGLADIGILSGEPVYGFGRSSLREEGSPYSRQAARAISDRSVNRGWTHTISSWSPGIPGDSGSAYLDAHGRALGTLSTLSLSLLLVSNGVSDLSNELAYARRHSGIKGLRLELGTVSFRQARADRWAHGRPPDQRS